MGERGPMPRPARRRRNAPTSIAVKGSIPVRRPAKPKGLTGEAAAEWSRIVPELEAMGLLARVDRGTLIRYVTYFADWCELDAKLRSTGLLIRANHRPGLAANPLARMRSDVAAHLLELGRQLLLTPNARVRAGVEHLRPDPDDALARRAELASIDAYRARLAGATEES